MSDQTKGMTECACGDSYPDSSYDAGFIDGSGLCANCDATLGVDIPSRQGEIDRLKAELEQYKLDAERLNFMISEQCIMQSQNGASGNSVYSLYWPHLGESQREWVKSPREAIDAALNQQQAKGCGACGDGCEGKRCRLNEESPPATISQQQSKVKP